MDINVLRYWLHRLPKIGDVTIYKLLDYYKDEALIYDAVIKKDKALYEILKKDIADLIINETPFMDIKKDYENMLNKSIRFITIYDEDYPERLKELPNMPYALYVKGKLPEDDVPSVAIIGARNCSEYGTFMANSFGEVLAEKGINIISGMARGIDGISQRGALNKNGRTYAVLGCGVDVCYPMGNYKLYKEIPENGGLLSTFPPGTEPLKRHFPERNKIVASLADLLLVIEARQKSGTSITVDLAIRMGKDVYAVPGRLTDRLSDGCNLLIKEGAGIALSPEDILKELTVIWNQKKPLSTYITQDDIKNINKYRPKIDEGVIKYLDSTPKSIEEIHKLRIKKEPSVKLNQTMSELILLCSEGSVMQVGSGYFYKVF